MSTSLDYLKLNEYVIVYIDLLILILQPEFADENFSWSCVHVKGINTFFSL